MCFFGRACVQHYYSSGPRASAMNGGRTTILSYYATSLYALFFYSVITWFKPAGPKVIKFKSPLFQKYGVLFRTRVFPIKQDPLVQKSEQVC